MFTFVKGDPAYYSVPINLWQENNIENCKDNHVGFLAKHSREITKLLKQLMSGKIR